MKTWGIIATILLVAAIGLGGWLYLQNKDLKSKNSKLQTDLSSAQAAKAQSDAKKVIASQKLELLTTIFAGVNSQEESLAMYDKIKSFNDETLTADWKAMQSSTPGDTTGDKMLTDLLTSTKNDLK